MIDETKLREMIETAIKLTDEKKKAETDDLGKMLRLGEEIGYLNVLTFIEGLVAYPETITEISKSGRQITVIDDALNVTDKVE